MFAVRQGRIDSLDLGALLGLAGWKSDLNAAFTATYSGAGDSAQTQFDLQMNPSTVNEAALDAGRLGVTMSRGDLHGQLSVEGPDGKLGTTVNGRVAPEGTKLHGEGSLSIEHLAKWTGRKDADGRIEGEFSLDGTADSAGLRTLAGTGQAMGGIGEDSSRRRPIRARACGWRHQIRYPAAAIERRPGGWTGNGRASGRRGTRPSRDCRPARRLRAARFTHRRYRLHGFGKRGTRLRGPRAGLAVQRDGEWRIVSSTPAISPSR